MYRSEASKREFKLISQNEHVARVTELIEKNFDSYFQALIKKYRDNDSLEKLKTRWSKNPALKTNTELVRELFAQAIENYEKEAEKYREAFDTKNLEEYRYDENAFKGYLTKGCPVITHSFYSRAEELSEWRKLFAMTPSTDLLDIFENLMEFSNEYVENYEEVEYKEYSTPDEFNFDEVEEDDYKITGVIGMGIKAVTLYHLHSNIFPRRGKMDLFGMYFLTSKSSFNLPTKTSEFIIINDKAVGKEGVYKVDHNYWYPYGLFTSYAMQLYKLIVGQCKNLAVLLDPKYRYVYVNTYLENISDCHAEDIQTLTRSSADYAASRFSW